MLRAPLAPAAGRRTMSLSKEGEPPLLGPSPGTEGSLREQKPNHPVKPEQFHSPTGESFRSGRSRASREAWSVRRREVEGKDIQGLAYFLYGIMFDLLNSPHFAEVGKKFAATSALDGDTLVAAVPTAPYVESIARDIGFDAEVLKRWVDSASKEMARASLQLVPAKYAERDYRDQTALDEHLAVAQRVATAGIDAPLIDHLALAGNLMGIYGLLPFAKLPGLLR